MWTAHCGITSVKLDRKKKVYVVRLKVFNSSFEIPPEVVSGRSEGGARLKATIELIEKTIPTRCISVHLLLVTITVVLGLSVLGTSRIYGAGHTAISKLVSKQVTFCDNVNIGSKPMLI